MESGPPRGCFATRGNIAASLYSNPVPTKVMVSHALSKKLVPPTSDAAEQQVRCIFKYLWAQRDYYRPKATDTLTTFHARLMAADGMGSFQAGQVLQILNTCNSNLLSIGGLLLPVDRVVVAG